MNFLKDVVVVDNGTVRSCCSTIAHASGEIRRREGGRRRNLFVRVSPRVADIYKTVRTVNDYRCARTPIIDNINNFPSDRLENTPFRIIDDIAGYPEYSEKNRELIDVHRKLLRIKIK